MRATTRGEIYRGTMPDPYGYDEPVDDNTTALEIRDGQTDFPISIIETPGIEYEEGSGTPRYVRKYTGRVPSFVPVADGDRVKDLRDGKFYVVGEVESMARGLSGRSSVTMTLRRTAP